MPRKGLSKKVRFEVFKRDSFTCQYCGKSAPDAVLQADHISPVSKGGENDLLNLITSCQDCNSGKGATELSDDTALQKQRAQLEELNQRREQLEMLIQWREGLKEIKDTEIEYLEETWSQLMGGAYSLNENGLRLVKRLAKKYPISDIADAMETSAEQYIKYDADGEPEKETVEKAINKIGGILRIRKDGNDDKDLYYIRGICRNRFNYVNEHQCIGLLRSLKKAGADIDRLKAIALEERNWTGWRYAMEAYLEELDA